MSRKLIKIFKEDNQYLIFNHYHHYHHHLVVVDTASS